MKTKKRVQLKDVLALLRRLQGTAAWPEAQRALDRVLAAARKEAH